MSDEPEDEDADEEDFAPEESEICAGSFVIHDLEWWRSPEGMNAVATQVTDECGVYVVDRDSGKLKAILLDDGKAKPKLSRIQ